MAAEQKATTVAEYSRRIPYSVLSHTADTGIEASAGSFADLISELATGMWFLMASASGGEEGTEVVINVSAPSSEDIVAAFLSELLYKAEVEDLFFCEFEVKEASSLAATVVAIGIPTDQVELTGPPIKAVTYHDLTVEENDDGWCARVYFDV